VSPENSPRILVVDDNALNRQLLEQQLAIHNYDVVLAEGGLEAVRLIESDHFDLVLLDVMMPDLDGYGVLEIVRKKKSSLELPIIMATARGESADIVKALNQGANDYVTKPIDLAVALARIETHLTVTRINNNLRISEDRLNLAMKGTSDGLWDWDLTTDTIFFSERWKAILNYGKEEIGSTPGEWFSRVHPDELSQLKTAIDDHLSGKTENCQMECRMLNKEGNYVWVRIRGAAVFNPDGKAFRFTGSLTDVTDEKTVDPLTGLPSRIIFSDRVERTLGYSQRAKHYDFAVIMLQMNAHTKISASLGPVATEDFLNATARRMTGLLEKEDFIPGISPENITISRFEGAEYALLTEFAETPADVSRLAEELKNVLMQPYALHGQEVYSAISIGIALGGPGYRATSEILRDAGIALERAKTGAPGTVQIFDAEMHQLALDRLRIEADLRRAISKNELALHCQPVIRVDSGQICGFEALARWNNAERGMVSPVVFIPLAEQLGIIDEIDDWIMRAACHFRQELIEKGLPAIDVAVNLSVRELLSTNLETRVDKLIKETGIDPKCVEMEVTESIFMQEIEKTVSLLKRLSEKGIRFSIDDFGTGYSSLAYLRRLPVSVLKIDKSFISDMETGGDARSIVSSIISMTHKLGLEVIAEGIEDDEQRDFIQHEGCDRAQGYFYSKPLTPEDFEVLLREQVARETAVTGEAGVSGEMLAK